VPQLESVRLDLGKKMVTVKTKPGKTLPDAKIKEIVTYSGYRMGKIERQK
jgi:hypothetical protein